MANLLKQVRSIAKEAAKSGKWKERKDGVLVCEMGKCTLASILAKRTEPLRKLQKEFEDLIKRAEKAAKGHIGVAPYSDAELFEDLPTEDNFPDPYNAAHALGIDSELGVLVAGANDTSLKVLRKQLAEGYVDEEEGEQKIKARIILEQELLSRKVK